MIDTLLTLSHVGYQYPGSEWQLANVDVVLNRGCLLGVVGPNGAGKSTMLKIAAGIVKPTQGEVNLCGKPLNQQPRRDIAQVLGYLPQSVRPSYDHSVIEVISMGRFCRQRGLGFGGAEDQPVVDHCLSVTETTHLAQRRLSQLSGGERQRVLLASVLAQEPDVLLLDEPTTGLDLHHQVTFFNLLSSFACQGLAMAVVTHDWNLAAQFCDRLLLMKDGGGLIEGTVEEVITAEILQDLYGPDLLVSTHPTNGRPIILPVQQGGTA